MTADRIINNTIFLYGRQFAVVVMSLYSVRVVFNELGVTDYAIFVAVAGFTTILSFLPNSLASASQRYFSIALGEKNTELSMQSFSINIIIYIVVAIISLLLLESVGLWFIKEHLVIPEIRVTSATRLYHFVVIGFVISIFSSPFISLLIAHERMGVYSMVSIITSLLKLLSAISLSVVGEAKLEYYGLFIVSTSLLTTLIYMAYCFNKFDECQIKKWTFDFNLAVSILSYTGWSIFGQLSSVFRNQAVTILINQYTNPSAVAARAISTAISSQALAFSQNLNTSLYAPIVKSYADKNNNETYNLVFIASKATFYLMWAITLPLFMNLGVILEIWLQKPPAETALFGRLALAEMLIMATSLPIATLARAHGEMKVYELSLGAIQFGIFIGSWLVLSFGMNAAAVFIVAIIGNLVMYALRILILRKSISFPARKFMKQELFPMTGVGIITFIIGVLINDMLSGLKFDAILGFISVFIINCIIIYYLGLDRGLRGHVKHIVRARLNVRRRG